MATNEGNYLVEVDGVAICQASAVETGGVKHEPFKIYTGTRETPVLGRGKYECEEVKIKQAYGLNNEAADFAQLFYDYVRGINPTKPSVRIVTLGEDGFSVVAIDDYVDCVVTMFQPEGKKGEGKEAAYFSIGFKPTDHFTSY